MGHDTLYIIHCTTRITYPVLHRHQSISHTPSSHQHHISTSKIIITYHHKSSFSTSFPLQKSQHLSSDLCRRNHSWPATASVVVLLAFDLPLYSPKIHPAFAAPQASDSRERCLNIWNLRKLGENYPNVMLQSHLISPTKNWKGDQEHPKCVCNSNRLHQEIITQPLQKNKIKDWWKRNEKNMFSSGKIIESSTSQPGSSKVSSWCSPWLRTGNPLTWKMEMDPWKSQIFRFHPTPFGVLRQKTDAACSSFRGMTTKNYSSYTVLHESLSTSNPPQSPSSKNFETSLSAISSLYTMISNAIHSSPPFSLTSEDPLRE